MSGTGNSATCKKPKGGCQLLATCRRTSKLFILLYNVNLIPTLRSIKSILAILFCQGVSPFDALPSGDVHCTQGSLRPSPNTHDTARCAARLNKAGTAIRLVLSNLQETPFHGKSPDNLEDSRYQKTSRVVVTCPAFSSSVAHHVEHLEEPRT
jgi:hypothetical protein